MRLIWKSSQNISLIFKSLDAEFLKRAEGDVYFTCDQVPEISKLVTAAVQSAERVEYPVHVTAKVPDKFGEDPIAKFTFVLSLKRKSSTQ
jgi:hypothetical protein